MQMHSFAKVKGWGSLMEENKDTSFKTKAWKHAEQRRIDEAVKARRSIRMANEEPTVKGVSLMLKKILAEK